MSTQLALGQVETIGLPTAIAAADAGVKSANVRLVGYELARGGGFVAVKFVGAVGAVQAAVAAAKVGATRAGMVRCSSVIARPSEQILALIYSGATVGVDQSEVVRFVRETAAAPATEGAPASEPPAGVGADAESLIESPAPPAADSADLPEASMVDDPAASPADPVGERSTEGEEN